MSQTVKLALKGLTLNMAAERRPHGIAAVALTPWFLRSGTMLERFNVTEETWREARRRTRTSLKSEPPLFVSRAVAALAADRAILERSGQLFSSWNSAVSTDSRTLTDGDRTGALLKSTSRNVRRSCLND